MLSIIIIICLYNKDESCVDTPEGEESISESIPLDIKLSVSQSRAINNSSIFNTYEY